MQSLNGQNVLVLGLGISGLAMARWASRFDAIVTVVDTRAEPPRLKILRNELPEIAFLHGLFDASLLKLKNWKYILKSPGLSPKEIVSVSDAIKNSDTRMMGELELFSMGLKGLKSNENYDPYIIAITGTNGKTTVTSLTSILIERSDKTVAIAGNIGPSLLDTLSQHMDAKTLPQVWVLELSSFQLDGAIGFEPHAATVLNITEDHLDWHGNIENYSHCKQAIFGKNTIRVLNRDDSRVKAMHSDSGNIRAKKNTTHCLFFGSTEPVKPGDFGLQSLNGMQWLVRANEAEAAPKRSREINVEVFLQRLMPSDALKIRGHHNALNALAALALASTVQESLASMLYGLREYEGEPHRMQSVAVINGVEYFDDSKGTNVGASVAAINSLGVERKLVLILGGDGKGQNFAPLMTPIACYARTVIMIGRDAEIIENTLSGSVTEKVKFFKAQSLEQAVDIANKNAAQGDAVLLSPACASLDMFRNYEHRAEVFREAVSKLAMDGNCNTGDAL